MLLEHAIVIYIENNTYTDLYCHNTTLLEFELKILKYAKLTFYEVKYIYHVLIISTIEQIGLVHDIFSKTDLFSAIFKKIHLLTQKMLFTSTS